MLKMIIILFIIFAGVNSVLAEVTFNEYQAIKDKTYFKAYLNGVGRGLHWAIIGNEIYLKSDKSLYCLPNNLTLTAENYINILEQEIKTKQKTETIPPDTFIELLLMNGLMRTFPCNQ